MHFAEKNSTKKCQSKPNLARLAAQLTVEELRRRTEFPVKNRKFTGTATRSACSASSLNVTRMSLFFNGGANVGVFMNPNQKPGQQQQGGQQGGGQQGGGGQKPGQQGGQPNQR
jgi:hypothetical protein